MNVQPRNLASAHTSPSPESRGLDFYHSDRSLKALLGLYLPQAELATWSPTSSAWAGSSATGSTISRAKPTRRRRGWSRAPARARTARPSSRRRPTGRWSGWRSASWRWPPLSHRPALGWAKPLSAASKYALTYLFAQSEFGLLCPVNMTDSLTRTIRRFAVARAARPLPAGAPGRGRRRPAAGRHVHDRALRRLRRGRHRDARGASPRSGDHWLLYRRQVVLLQRRCRPGAGAGAARGRAAPAPPASACS